jgi:LuxR family quorum sensing-dependent transcriptional regulator
MRAGIRALDFIEALNEKTSAGDVGRTFQAYISQFGFTHFLIGRITPDTEKQDRGEMWAQSWPNDWYQIWTKRYYRLDPLVERARSSRAPFRWTDLRDEFVSRGLHVFEDAKEFGISDGLSASYSLGGGAIAGITIGTPKFDLDPGANASVLLALAYCELKLAHLAHQAGKPSPLSDRERECLCWVAAGKTDWEISEILGISQQTVHKHVSNALKKLNASTRAHAIAMALQSRLISF